MQHHLEESICECGQEPAVAVIAERRASIVYCDEHARRRLSELEVNGEDDEELQLIVMVLTQQLQAAWRSTRELG